MLYCDQNCHPHLSHCSCSSNNGSNHFLRLHLDHSFYYYAIKLFPSKDSSGTFMVICYFIQVGEAVENLNIAFG